MTLTSSPESPSDIHRGYERLVKRIRRRHGRYEYVAVKELTKSGLVHLHVLWRGSYIEQSWLSNVWKEIHNAQVVYVELMKCKRNQIGSYLVKYLEKDVSASYRFWCSWNWVFRGFVSFWNRVVRVHGERAVRVWKTFLWGGWIKLDRWCPGPPTLYGLTPNGVMKLIQRKIME